MLSLFELWQRTLASYPGAAPYPRQLLLTWMRDDAEGDWPRLLEGTGRTSAQLQALLEQGWAGVEGEERSLLDGLLNSPEPGSLGALQLVRELLRRPEHPFSRFIGLENRTRVAANLERLEKQAPGLLAAHGIAPPEPRLLERFGRDLTAEAKDGRFDALAARDDDLERLTQVLLRAQKGNPVLTGPAGVGKTALVELLARKLARGEAPRGLQGARVVELSMGKLVAGTRYRGDFEERFEQVMAAARSQPGTLLFIDELHLIWGAGRAEGVVMDASNLLKPYLARSELRLIGATTVAEYRKYIATDPALARRFQEIRLREPDPAQLVAMVAAQARQLERHHGVSLDEAIVTRAIELTDQHLRQRRQPDKSVDLLDCACVDATRAGAKALQPGQLLETLARMLGRPLVDAGEAERQRLRELPTALKRRILGQDAAIDRVCATVLHRRLEYGERERCLGSFLFVGETGTGKTELARLLAAEYFARPDALLHLDMAEYATGDAVDRLVGGPLAGDDAGRLVAWLQGTESGLILFAEIEKAHPAVIRLLLGLLDHGRVTGGASEPLDARACVVVLTSNALLPAQLRKQSIGFAGRPARADVEALLASSFPAELLGRLDELIVFERLGELALTSILQLQLAKMARAFEKRQVRLEYEPQQLCGWLMERFDRTAAGVRGLQRLVETRLSQPVSQAVLVCDYEGPVRVAIDERFYTDGTLTAVPE